MQLGIVATAVDDWTQKLDLDEIDRLFQRVSLESRNMQEWHELSFEMVNKPTREITR